MSEEIPLQVSEEVAGALAEVYWLFPFTKPARVPGASGRVVSLPLPPRPAPWWQIQAAAERIGHAIPDWVPALWCCDVILGVMRDQKAEELGTYLAETSRLAREAGAPESVVFFAGSSSLFPGTESYSKKGKKFVQGELASFVYGFEPAAVARGDAPELVEYLHTAKDPERRLKRRDLASWLRERARDSRMNDTDSEVFSKETYASILWTREQPRPAFELRWEKRTPPPPKDEPAAETPALPSPPPAPARVEHAKFGVGTVVAREGAGDAEKLTIEFAAGTKTILARFVRPVAD